MKVQFVSVTPTVTASSAYTAGDCVGGLMTFEFEQLRLSEAIVIEQIRVIDLAKQGADLDFLVFRSNPSGSTFTDKSACDVADADTPKLVGHLSLTADSLLNDNNVSTLRNIGLYVPVSLRAAGQKVYVQAVARGTPTYAATTDIKVEIAARTPD
jgi:hypothetical protein